MMPARRIEVLVYVGGGRKYSMGEGNGGGGGEGEGGKPQLGYQQLAKDGKEAVWNGLC